MRKLTKTRQINNIVINESTIKNELLFEYEQLFKEQIDTKSICKVSKHNIDTENSKPIYCKTSLIPIHYESDIDEEIQKNLKLWVIRPSNSPWNSRIVPVTKPDGSLRMCIDFQPLNKCTVKDKYLIPRINEILDALSEARYFSTLDAKRLIINYYLRKGINVKQHFYERRAFQVQQNAIWVV